MIGEFTGQPTGPLIVGPPVPPGVARIQDFVRHTGTAQRDGNVKNRVLDVLNLFEVTVHRRLDQGPGQVDVHALPLAERSAAPAGVDEKHLGLVALHALTQHPGVDIRVAGHEGLAKETGKGGLGLDDAGLGAGQLAGVAEQEPEHRLSRVEPADRRQHPVGIGGQKKNGPGMAGPR